MVSIMFNREREEEELLWVCRRIEEQEEKIYAFRQHIDKCETRGLNTEQAHVLLSAMLSFLDTMIFRRERISARLRMLNTPISAHEAPLHYGCNSGIGVASEDTSS
jgi:hypothetical protein